MHIVWAKGIQSAIVGDLGRNVERPKRAAHMDSLDNHTISIPIDKLNGARYWRDKDAGGIQLAGLAFPKVLPDP
jgi:hypothetical protein